VPNGRLVVSAPVPGPGPGDAVRLRVFGGMRYARDDADEAWPVGPPAVKSTDGRSEVAPLTTTEGGT